MTWLDQGGGSEPPGDRLARLYSGPGILRLPGAHNALAGRLAQRAGFEALYLSGAAISASLGLPDLGVMTLEELCFVTRAIFRATGLPLVVDADTGYGGALNVTRTVRELEQAGAAAIQIEDQVLPKKCGHLDDKRLVAPREMCAKIAAARRARRHLRIVARTDAVASEGLEAAIGRARLYLEAGADILFPEALPDEAAMAACAAALDAPLLANMTEFGRTPYLSAQAFEALGFKLVIWPVSALRVAARAMEELYAGLMSEGEATGFLDRMQSRDELHQVLGYDDYEVFDRELARGLGDQAP